MGEKSERKRCREEEELEENCIDDSYESDESYGSEDEYGECCFPILKEDPKLLMKSYWDDEQQRPKQPFNEEQTMADFDEDDSDYIPRGETKADRELWLKYYKQIWESDGFDIEDFPGECVSLEMVPDCITEKVEVMTRMAIDKYNVHNGEAYELVEIEKVNSGPAASLYYITFRVRNTKTSGCEEEVFQAKTFGEKSMVILCRPRPNTKI